MAFTNRYQKTIKGNLIQIGNTLGLSKATNTNTPGTLGSIGAFITTQNIAASGWPNNTTLNFSQNSSTSILTLPSGAVVDYAELIWSASYVVPGADVTSSIGNAINFTDPRGIVNSITATGVNITNIALSENSENSTNYVKSADVTSIVSQAGSGTYTCGNVPCTMSPTANNLQYAGWSLYVVYKLSTEPVRNIIIFTGQTVSIDVPYAVPINYPGPPFKIRIFYSVGEGDAIITGDQFNTRPGTGVIVANIGTPVQPANSNPFSSIIGNQSGGIDTSGSFGTFNPSGTAGTNISGGRQGWDIANNIDITSAFTGGAVSSLGLDIGTNSDPAIMNSNGFVVDLSQPIATLTKSVDKTTAKAGDTLTYTLVYKFTTVPMSTANITIIDTVPNGLTYQSGSVTVNGISQPLANPNPPGINLGTITSTATFTVLYKATVNNVIQTTTIPNDAFGAYDFVSGGTAFTNNDMSNSVLTTIDPVNATALKSVDKAFADIGDILTYTITIPNNGITLNNVFFKDTIPNGTAFISNSFQEDGVTIASANPNLGVTINNISLQSIKTITFKVLVTTLPTINPIPNSGNITFKYNFNGTNDGSGSLNTNIVSTKINNGDLTAQKTVNKAFANVNDVLTYTIVLKNIGNNSSENVIFNDAIPLDTTFVNNSFTENGVTRTGINPQNGPTLSNIGIGRTTTVTFQVKVDTIPSPNPIPNNSRIFYTFFFSPSQTGKSAEVTSNTVVTTINNANLSNSLKIVDKSFANCGDIITYTVLIPNTGNVTAQNIFFKDTIPSGTIFVTNSVTLNGVIQSSANPAAGITLPDILPGGVTTITFKVQVQC